MNGGVADPHRDQRIDASFREVLRHSFDQPQRKGFEIEAAAIVGHRCGDVELENVHKLVTENVIVLGVIAGERKHHAIHERIGESAGALADDLRRGGGLLEICGIRVQDDGLAREGVIEQSRISGVPTLRHAADIVDHVRFEVVVIDVEVLGFDDLEIEMLPLDFVASEVLSIRSGCQEEEGQDDNDGLAHRSHLEIFGTASKFAAAAGWEWYA